MVGILRGLQSIKMEKGNGGIILSTEDGGIGITFINRGLHYQLDLMTPLYSESFVF